MPSAPESPNSRPRSISTWLRRDDTPWKSSSSVSAASSWSSRTRACSASTSRARSPASTARSAGAAVRADVSAPVGTATGADTSARTSGSSGGASRSSTASRSRSTCSSSASVPGERRPRQAGEHAACRGASSTMRRAPSPRTSACWVSTQRTGEASWRASRSRTSSSPRERPPEQVRHPAADQRRGVDRERVELAAQLVDRAAQHRRVKRHVDARQHAHRRLAQARRERGDRVGGPGDRVLAAERVVVDDLDVAGRPAPRAPPRRDRRPPSGRATRRPRRAGRAPASPRRGGGRARARPRAPAPRARAAPRTRRRCGRRRRSASPTAPRPRSSASCAAASVSSAGCVSSVRYRTPSGWRTTRPPASRSSRGLRSTTSSSEKPSCARVCASARSQTARAARERARPSAPRPRRWTPWPGKTSAVGSGATSASPSATSVSPARTRTSITRCPADDRDARGLEVERRAERDRGDEA